MENTKVLKLLKRCKRYDIPFFFKQWGGEKKAENGRELAGQIWSELPRTGLKS